LSFNGIARDNGRLYGFRRDTQLGKMGVQHVKLLQTIRFVGKTFSNGAIPYGLIKYGDYQPIDRLDLA
jgi:hypothetical protein